MDSIIYLWFLDLTYGQSLGNPRMCIIIASYISREGSKFRSLVAKHPENGQFFSIKASCPKPKSYVSYRP